MKTTIYLGILLFVSIIAGVSISGCIGADPIVGSWKESRTGATITFNPDNTATTNVMGMSVPGKWNKVGDGAYTIMYTAGGTAGVPYSFQMDKNGKTMTSGYGILTEMYTKVS